MSNRKQHIENIIRNMHAIRRKLMAIHGAKSPFMKFQKTPITLSQWPVLVTLMEKDRVGVKEIAESLGITSSASTQLVDGLVKNGYLVRESDANDRRALLLRLSDKHRRKMSEIRATAMKRFNHMFDALSDNELIQYAKLNKKITDNILKTKPSKK